jgi:hypothetical protein
MRCAAHDNNDGIGVMSKDEGVHRFLGSKMVKRAWRHIKRLNAGGHEFAVHFRYATHGRIALANVHPFATPQNDAYVMHNGILGQYIPEDRNGMQSDTQLFVKHQSPMADVADSEYWDKMADHIGSHNKLCVMSWDGRFKLVNAEMGDWINGVWYSQTYSLPATNARWFNNYEDNYTRIFKDKPTYEGGWGRVVEGAGHTHYMERGTYYQTQRDEPLLLTHDTDAEALDAALAEHIQDGDGNFICESCEAISTINEDDIQGAHVQCPICGYIDMDDGMLSYAGSM